MKRKKPKHKPLYIGGPYNGQEFNGRTPKRGDEVKRLHFKSGRRFVYKFDGEDFLYQGFETE